MMTRVELEASLTVTLGGEDNCLFVRRLLAENQPRFAAVLDVVVREIGGEVTNP